MHTVVETTDGAYHVVRDGRVIARVDTFNPFDAEAKALAEMFAAAPEMLEALEAAQAAYEAYDRTDDSPESYMRADCAEEVARKKVCDALSKLSRRGRKEETCVSSIAYGAGCGEITGVNT